MSKAPLSTPNILLFFLTLLLFHFPISVISMSDQAILLKIKRYWAIETWDSSKSPCSWHGVNCTDGKSVIGISLGGQLFVNSDLPPYICDLQDLTTLDLSNNLFTGKFPTFLYNCTKLQSLDLSKNDFGGQLPKDINKLSPNLQNLHLGYNTFTGDIPTSLAQLKELNTLNLSSNLFNTTFPSELGSLEKLRELDLSNNPFGLTHLPNEFGMLKSLKILEMSECQLTGEIPNDFSKLTSLKKLSLKYNNLVGGIPAALSFLTELVLAGNQLSGVPPSNIVSWNSLETLDLANNNLSGPVPAALGSLPRLVNLDLSNNKLSGPIPETLGYLPSLGNLDLSNNKLSGPIPKTLGYLPSLGNLDLSNNKLSGPIPKTLRYLPSLGNLDLSNNKLSGPIPKTLGSLHSLGNLDLSNNKLSGEIPPELAQLPSGVLDLSSNRLSGKIPEAFHQNFFYSFEDNANLCADTNIDGIPRCYFSRRKAILVISGTIFLGFVSFTFIWVIKGKHRKQSNQNQEWELTQFHRMDFTEIVIVSGLTDNNIIGSGGSGNVYMIIVNDSDDKVAVKRIWNGRTMEHALEKQFLAEVEFLGTLRHANIVKLLCCVSSEKEKLLVYEYMENKSLDRWLHRKRRTSSINSEVTSSPDPDFVLDWQTRLRIAIGAAKGICYLHHDCSPPVIHRDLKSSNILLDSEFNAKIADFGLAKMTVNKTGEPHTASAVVGSFGYIAPEYWCTKKLNEKIDVYSFGVVLLELVTGKEPCKGNSHLNLADWSWKHCCEEHPINDIIDEDIKDSGFMKQIENVFKLGLMCTSPMSASRPTMKQVLRLLIEWSCHEDRDQIRTSSQE